MIATLAHHKIEGKKTHCHNRGFFCPFSPYLFIVFWQGIEFFTLPKHISCPKVMAIWEKKKKKKGDGKENLDF
jgi:hypothetical protein